MSRRADYDVVVVGAGPGGGMAALTAARRGLRTALLEEHPAVGTPTHCTGKLQVHAFHEFALPQHLSLNSLKAGVFFAPDGAALRVRRLTPDSHVVDRDTFDRWLADAAQQAGADLLLGTRVRGAEPLNGGMRVTGLRGSRTVTMTASIIIDAEGARPVLPGSLGVRLARRWITGLQYQVADVEFEDEDCPEIYLGADVAPGFFAWLMPLGERRGRVGLCVDPRLTQRPAGYFIEHLMRDHPIASRRLRHATIERKLAGPIPLLGQHRPSVISRMLVVGDAAGHVKATSGGGIYYAMIAGHLAARAAAEHLGGDPRALGRYEQAWRRRFGRELRFTAFARQTLNLLTDRELNRLIRAMRDDAALIAAIEERGDTAYQSRLLSLLLQQGVRWTLRTRPMAAVLVKAFRAGVHALWEDGVVDAIIRGKSPAGAESLEQTIGS